MSSHSQLLVWPHIFEIFSFPSGDIWMNRSPAPLCHFHSAGIRNGCWQCPVAMLKYLRAWVTWWYAWKDKSEHWSINVSFIEHCQCRNGDTGKTDYTQELRSKLQHQTCFCKQQNIYTEYKYQHTKAKYRLWDAYLNIQYKYSSLQPPLRMQRNGLRFIHYSPLKIWKMKYSAYGRILSMTHWA